MAWKTWSSHLYGIESVQPFGPELTKRPTSGALRLVFPYAKSSTLDSVNETKKELVCFVVALKGYSI